MSAGLYAVHTALIWGAQALPVTAEVSMSAGIPGISIVGRPDSSVCDAPPRVRSAITASGFEQPRYHITVNLAPGEIKKSGTGFDLPIAVATLAANNQIPTKGLDSALFVGELGLDGTVCPVRGMVAYALLAKTLGIYLVAASTISLPEGLNDVLIPLSSLAQLKCGLDQLRENRVGAPLPTSNQASERPLDFSDVIDQEIAKRAFVIAAAGRHGMLMIGPPGSGKTMLARRMPSILPPMSMEEQMDTLLIRSVAGERDAQTIQLADQRPFRSPHHSVTSAGMVGGGKPVLPGEISLAHHGVLFLDELPEFAPSVLQMLRQPMEDKRVNIVRVDGSFEFPCDFQLIAAANPCPCGYLGDPGHQCRCTPAQIDRYQGRIGGPLIDRIDLMINVARPNEERVIEGSNGMSSQQMRELVITAREFCAWRTERYKQDKHSGTVKSALLDESARKTLTTIARSMAFGGRAIVRVVRVARTIADLDEREFVTSADIIEASSYRTRVGELS